METDIKELITYASGGVLGLLGLSVPLMKILRMYKLDKSENAKSDGEASIYVLLKDQVENLAKSLEKARDESDTLLQEMALLKTRVIHLEGFEASNIRLREKLGRKDDEIKEWQTKFWKNNKLLEGVKDRLSRYETITAHTDVLHQVDSQDSNIMSMEDLVKESVKDSVPKPVNEDRVGGKSSTFGRGYVSIK